MLILVCNSLMHTYSYDVTVLLCCTRHSSISVTSRDGIMTRRSSLTRVCWAVLQRRTARWCRRRSCSSRTATSRSSTRPSSPGATRSRSSTRSRPSWAVPSTSRSTTPTRSRCSARPTVTWASASSSRVSASPEGRYGACHTHVY